jgi:SecD/SecF fusion protein
MKDPIQKREKYKELRSAYLDSMSTETVFKIPLLKNYTYADLKAQQLAFGLDLKGGMSVVLQVDLREFIRALAQDSKDPTFVSALEAASSAQRETQQDFVSLFADAWQAQSGDKQLAPIFMRNEALRDEINLTTSDGEVVRTLREKADETVELTYQLLRQRIDQLGVVQPNVSLDNERDLILVELPGVDNPRRAREYLQAAANLEFFKVYRNTEADIFNSLIQADQRLKEMQGDTLSTEPEIASIDTSYVLDSLGMATSEIASIDTSYVDPALEGGPLLSRLQLFQPDGSAIVGIASRNERDDVLRMLQEEEVQSLFPNDLAFRWGREPIANPNDESADAQLNANNFFLYAIKLGRNGQAPLTGESVIEASAQPDPNTNAIGVSLTMDKDGAKTWGQITTEAANDNQRQVAILLDSLVVSAPSVNEPIPGGRTSITGNFSVQEATDLANILQVGRLPARTEIIQESLVGPSLGAENIRSSLIALSIGFLLVFAFMVFYYGGGGLVSNLALILNLIFIFGSLSSYGTVLTLPGIAGIILTIGMAVDANVIIFERIREELRDGKNLRAAVVDGFKNSYSAIIDANVTTLLTAFVLAYFGLGPIKGFAVVLIIGVLCSVFTAVLVGRLIIEWWLDRGKSIGFWTKTSENAFANLNVDWLGKRKVAYAISGTLLVLSLASFVVRGFELGVDFRGGFSYNVQFDPNLEVDRDVLADNLTNAFNGESTTVKVVDTENTFNIVTSYGMELQPADGLEPADQVMNALFTGVQQTVGTDLDQEQFEATDADGTHVVSFSQVGPTIADDITRSAFNAAIFALLLIFLYIFLRFSRWQYSLGAVAALFHDTIITLGIFSMLHGILPFNMEIDQAFIAAILTVIGYSINDTVVVFDRIREFLNMYLSGSKTEVINRAVNSTVSRTVITSLTTLFVVGVLFFFGGDSIRGFAFALLIGIMVGTYSSIFIATPIVHDFSDQLRAQQRNKTAANKGRFSKALEADRP